MTGAVSLFMEEKALIRNTMMACCCNNLCHKYNNQHIHQLQLMNVN